MKAPASGAMAFDLTPEVFREIAEFTREAKVRVVDRTIIAKPKPGVIIWYKPAET